MRIRTALPKNYQAVVDMIGSEEELFKIYPAGQFPFTCQQIEQLAETRTDLTVIEEQGRVVGFANLYGHTERHVFIGDVVVCKDHRGKGIGRALVRHMTEIAIAKYRVEAVRLSVFCSNTAALLLYLGSGFKPYDMEERLDCQGQRTVLLHLQYATNPNLKPGEP